jgi:hypothetical protein
MAAGPELAFRTARPLRTSSTISRIFATNQVLAALEQAKEKVQAVARA